MSPEQYMLPCAYKQFLGIDCPLCGFQRSLLLLCRADVTGSFKMYPPLLPVLSLIVLSAGHVVNRKAISGKMIRNWSVVTLTIVMVNYLTKQIIGH